MSETFYALSPRHEIDAHFTAAGGDPGELTEWCCPCSDTCVFANTEGKCIAGLIYGWNTKRTEFHLYSRMTPAMLVAYAPNTETSTRGSDWMLEGHVPTNTATATATSEATSTPTTSKGPDWALRFMHDVMLADVPLPARWQAHYTVMGRFAYVGVLAPETFGIAFARVVEAYFGQQGMRDTHTALQVALERQQA